MKPGPSSAWLAVAGIAIALVASAASGAAAAAAAAGQADPAKAGADGAARVPAETWYASAIAQSDQSFRVTHLWSKGDRFRAETVIAGRRIVTIVNGSTYYTIDPVRGFGLGIERSELALGEDARRGRPFGVEYEMILLGGGELVKKDELGGQEVELYRLTNNAGRVEVWVTPTAKLPIRVERFVRSTGRREQVSYVDWRSGVDIADSFFEPSPNLKIDRMGYEEYVKRTMAERLGPAPPLHSQLLHGEHRRR